MRLLLVALAALTLTGTTQAALREAKDLEPAASFVAGKPVRVFCSSLTAKNGEHGLATPGATDLFLDAAVCPHLREALTGAAIGYLPTLADVIAILTHESIHLRGERDEGKTECAAMHEMPRVAVKFFGIIPGKQLRALMASAWVSYRKEAPAYRTVCG